MIRLVLVLLLTVSSLGVQAGNPLPAPPQLAAKAYLLVDAASGAVLVEHNADEILPPASLTKTFSPSLHELPSASTKSPQGFLTL